jgi:hypothetical protein
LLNFGALKALEGVARTAILRGPVQADDHLRSWRGSNEVGQTNVPVERVRRSATLTRALAIVLACNDEKPIEQREVRKEPTCT